MKHMKAKACLSVLLVLGTLNASCSCKEEREECSPAALEGNAGPLPSQGEVPLILVVANTKFEADGLMKAMIDLETKPAGLPARMPPSGADDRIRGLRARYKTSVMDLEVLCVHDAVEAGGGTPDGSDLSDAKIPRLEGMLRGTRRLIRPTLVIAFGTAAFPDENETHNGSVYVGSAVLIHSRRGLSGPDPVEYALRGRGLSYNSVIPSPGGDRILRRVITIERRDW